VGVVTGGIVGDEPPPQAATAASATARTTRLGFNTIGSGSIQANETPRLTRRGPEIK
jgi:hypothetical protein